MPDVLTIPADLTPVLRREALDHYGQATERAHRAVEGLLANKDHERYMELAGALVEARVDVLRMGELLEELADDIYTKEEETIELTRGTREALHAVLAGALDTDSLIEANMTPEQVVEVGRRFEGLLALRAQLDGEAVTA